MVTKIQTLMDYWAQRGSLTAFTCLLLVYLILNTISKRGA